MDNHSGFDLPVGFEMALAENLDAMNYFSSLPSGRQNEIISFTHQINSKQEMRKFVRSLGKN
ncbi:MAG: hypothetical protein RR540_07890 [Oscillospiraceae bacterium]